MGMGGRVDRRSVHVRMCWLVHSGDRWSHRVYPIWLVCACGHVFVFCILCVCILYFVFSCECVRLCMCASCLFLQLVAQIHALLPFVHSGIRLRLVMLYAIVHDGIGPEASSLLSSLSIVEQVRCGFTVLFV